MNQNVLYVRMFGNFSLTYADKQISCNSNRSKLIWNLLAYLLCHRGKLISSEELIPIIWKHEKNDNPAGAMRTAIHRARAMLNELTDDSDSQFLISKNGGYMWNSEIEVNIDIDSFDNILSSFHSNSDSPDIDTAIAALDLYTGKFLPLQSSEMWVMPIQTYYHNLYESLIDKLVPILEKSDRCMEGIRICRAALNIDPYSEKLYQYLMRFLLIADERQEVIRIYDEMSKLLLSTFGIMPDQESRALYREALNSVRNSNAVSPEMILDQLREHDEINTALICDYDFFKMLYQAHARAIVRSGIVIHTALLTLKSRSTRDVSAKSLSLAMDNLEKHLGLSLRKGDIIARCSSSQIIIMLPLANQENSHKICQRFISSFEKKYPHSPIYIDYYVQPMSPSTLS